MLCIFYHRQTVGSNNYIIQILILINFVSYTDGGQIIIIKQIAKLHRKQTFDDFPRSLMIDSFYTKNKP